MSPMAVRFAAYKCWAPYWQFPQVLQKPIVDLLFEKDAVLVGSFVAEPVR